jgi:5'-3' exonuclease
MATSFKNLTSLEPNTLMVVDSLNLAFRWKHSGAKTFLDEYMRTIDSLRKSYKAGKVIITCDEGSSSYRKSIFPEYKSGRKEKYSTQTLEEKAAFEAFLTEFSRVIDTYKEVGDYPVLKFSQVEADDLAAYIVRKYKKTHSIWLMSSDKDWDLLIDDNVSRFSYVTRKEITKNNWNEHYDYNVDDHISIKCLTGDSGDSIPGVPGIGPVKAQSLVKTYGSTYDVISSLPISSKYKYISSLNEFGADNLIRNYKLMDLVTYCEEAIGKDNCDKIDKILGEYL